MHDVSAPGRGREALALPHEPRLELSLPDQRYLVSRRAGQPVLDVTLTPGDTLYLPARLAPRGADGRRLLLHHCRRRVYTGSTRCAQRSRRRCEEEDGYRRARLTVKSCCSSCWGWLQSGCGEACTPAPVEVRVLSRPIRSDRFDQLRGCASSTPRRRSNDVTASCSTSRPAIRKSHSRSKGGESRFPRTHARSSRRLRARRGAAFRAADLPGKLDEEGRLVLVRRLVREGFLRVSLDE